MTKKGCKILFFNFYRGILTALPPKTGFSKNDAFFGLLHFQVIERYILSHKHCKLYIIGLISQKTIRKRKYNALEQYFLVRGPLSRLLRLKIGQKWPFLAYFFGQILCFIAKN